MAKSFEISLASKGIFIALVLSLILTLILSLVYFLTSIQESVIHSLIITGVSVFFAGFYVSLQTGSKGLIYGLSIGFGFLVLSLLIYFIFYEGSPSWLIILEKTLVSLISGAIGGTVGAILKK